MSKTRLLTLLLTLALALGGASAVVAQDETPAPEPGTLAFGPFDSLEQREGAMEAFVEFDEAMHEVGLVDDSIGWATDWLQNWYSKFGIGEG